MPGGTRKLWRRVLVSGVGLLLLAQALGGPIAAFAATIQTDVFVYQSGDTVTVTGAGFGATETVDLVTVDPVGTTVDSGAALTDATGAFSYAFVLNATVSGLYTVTGTGVTSALSASTQFDPQDKTSITEVLTPSTVTWGTAITASGTLTDTETNMPIGGATVAIGTYPNVNCNNAQVALGSATTGTNGTFSLNVNPPAGSLFVGAVYAGEPQAHQAASKCIQVTVNAATTATTASLAPGTISTSGTTVVTWTVSSTSGVTGSIATGTATVVKDSGPGTIVCTPASVAVSQSETGTGFTFTPNAAQKFTCSANASGAYTIHVHFADSDGNYSNSDSGSLSLTVTTPTATLSATQANGTYGGTASLSATLTAGVTPLAGKSISFTLNGTSVGASTTNASGVASLPSASLDSISAATYPSGVGVAFAGDSSYSAASATAALTVNKAVLTVTADGKSRAYGAANPVLTASFSGFVLGQTLATSGVTGSPSLTTPATTNSPVGSYTITAAIGTLAAGNYSFAFVNGTLTIGPVALTITADSKSKVYGAALPALTVSYSGFVNGDTAASLTTPPTVTTTATAASHVGTYPITASGAVDANYTISYVAGTLTVTPAPLTITASDQTKAYGASLPTLTVSYSGFVNGDTAASLTTHPTVTTSATASSHVAGNPYTITASGAVDADYNVTYVSGTLTVTTVVLTIQADSKTKAYGAAMPALTVFYSGFVNGDTTTSLTAPPTVATGATAASHVGAYAITASGAVDSDYAIGYQAGTMTVTPVGLTITADDKTKAYGAALPALTVRYAGFVNGDTSASLMTQPTIATDATAHSTVGSYSITASGAVDPDYTITYVAGHLTVSAASLVITANDQTKVYGAALPALTVGYSGFVNGDTAASLTTQPTVTTTATASSHVGSYTITASGAVDPNYTIAYVPGALTVTPAPLTITADAKSKAYGAALPALTVSYSGFVNGDTASSLTTPPAVTTNATASSHVAGNPYAITASGALDADYTISYVSGTLTVTPVPLTITADNKTKAYGAALPALTASYSGLINGDTSTSLTTQPTLTTTATPASHVAGNPYSITASGAVDPDYFISYVGGTLTVTPVALTITADSKSKAYGAALPALTASYSGFVNGDTAASLTTQPTLRTTATAASHVAGNPYSITASGAVDTDYNISYVGGTLTVTPVALTITADSKSKAYGVGLPALTAGYVGLVNGDTSASLTTQPTLTTTATAASHVAGSPYAITASGAVDPDYTISYIDGNLTVTPVALTITADDQTKAYGAPLPALTMSYSGFVNGEGAASLTVLPTVVAHATAANHVGSYVISASGAVDTDYLIYYGDGTLTITPVPLTIKADDKTKTYGAPLPTLTACYVGFVNGDDPGSLGTRPTLSTTVTAASHVGSYAITAAGAVDADYTISYAAGTLTVSPKALTINADAKSKAYGDPLPELTVSYDGFVDGDTSASLTTPPTIATAATGSSHVGAYAITASGAVDADYTIGYIAGSLTITPVPLTITAVGQDKAYGASLPALTVSYAGFVSGDTSASLTTPPTVTSTATQSSHVGAYPITASGAVDGDYNIAYVAGTLTITPVPLTITADPKSKAYGAPLPALTANYSGLVNGDTPAALATQPSLSTSATGSSHVGSYAISIGGAADPDYLISYSAGTLTVTPVPLFVIAIDKSKPYGGPLPALTVSYSGFVNGDTEASLASLPQVVTNATAASHVAGNPYNITASGAVDPDYEISYIPGTLTVTAVPLTISADSKSKAYGVGLPALTASYVGLVNGDTFTSLSTQPTLSTTATAASHVAGSPYAITASGAVDPDYTISYIDGNLTVRPVALTITADSKTKAYGAALPSLTASYSGFVNGDTAAALTTQPTLSATATAASHAAGGPYAITASGAVDPDYVIYYGDGTLTITPVPLTIKADDHTKIYGAPLPTVTASYVGFVNGDDPGSLGTRPTLSTTATAASHVGSYAITAAGAVDPDYTISYAAGTLTVTPAALLIRADDQSNAYGAQLPVLTASYAGFVNGDTPASLTTPVTVSTNAIASSHVGTYTITASGAADDDYAISYATGSLTVTPVALTITADSKTKTYGAALPTLTASYSGFVNGDTAAALTTQPTLSTTTTEASHVAGGPYPITASGAVDPDYVISYVPGTLAVTPVPLVITADSKTKAYGAALPSLTATYAGVVNGDTSAALTTQPTLSTSASASSHVGTYTITVAGAVDSDYTISYVSGSLTVTPVALTITADSKTKAYGAAVPALTASYAGFVNGDTSAALTTQPTLTTSATASSHVGTFTITAVGAVDSDYTISYVSGTLTVTPVPLTITADSKTKVYGAALPGLTASYAGFVNGDTQASLTTQPVLSTTATAASHVGTYVITVSGAADVDYTISYVAGSVTVTTAALTITADNKTKAYGGSLPALTVSYAGFVNGDTSASLGTQATVATSATAASHVGSYPINVSGAVDSDYTIGYVSGTLTVTPVPLTITADSKTKAYGAALPGLTASYATFVNGDTAASLGTQPALTTSATSTSHVGTYTINVSGAVDNDYTISYVSGTLTVSPVPLTITADNKTKAYGVPLPALTASYTGLVNGDISASLTTQPTLTTTATAASHVAGNPYSITASIAVDADYTISYVAGTLTVTQVPLLISADDKTMVLNAAALPALTASYSGFVNGDTSASLTVPSSLTTTAVVGSPIGKYTITASGAIDADYTITYKAGTLSVVFAASTISCAGQPGRTVLQPVNLDGSSVFKAGSTVPIKFRVCDANGNPIGGSGAVVKVGSDSHMDPVIYASGTNSNPVDETVVSTTPDADFRWDAANQQWIFNMSTKNLKAGVHYFLRIDLVDGTSIYFDFSTK